MKNYVSVVTVTAGVIAAIKQIVPNGDYHVTVEGTDDPVHVRREWVDHQLPQLGDYLVKDGHQYEVMKPREFDAKFKPVDDVEEEAPAGGGEDTETGGGEDTETGGGEGGTEDQLGLNGPGGSNDG